MTLPKLRETTGNPAAKIDTIVGLDARGFLFGPLLALRLGAAFVPVRKQGKLPGKCFQAQYEKEVRSYSLVLRSRRAADGETGKPQYGVDTFEMQEGAIKEGQNVVIIDDLIATGGSALAATQLVQQSKGNVVQNLFVVDVRFIPASLPHLRREVDSHTRLLVPCRCRSSSSRAPRSSPPPRTRSSRPTKRSTSRPDDSAL